MSTENLEDAVKACEISLKEYVEAPCIVCYGTCDEEVKELLHMLPEMKNVTVHKMPLSEPPEMETDGIYGEVLMEKQEWKKRIKEQVKRNSEIQTGGGMCEWKCLFDLSGSTCAS